MHAGKKYASCLVALLWFTCVCALAQVTYKPYIQPG